MYFCNELNGTPVADDELVKKLALSEVDRSILCAVPDGTRQGLLLAVTLLDLRMGLLRKENVSDFLIRALFRQSCDEPVAVESAGPLPEIHAKLVQWFAAGWTCRVDSIHLEQDRFEEHTRLTIIHEVDKEVRDLLDQIHLEVERASNVTVTADQAKQTVDRLAAAGVNPSSMERALRVLPSPPRTPKDG